LLRGEGEAAAGAHELRADRSEITLDRDASAVRRLRARSRLGELLV